MSEAPARLVVRGGSVLDGTGAPAVPGDVLVDDGLVTGIVDPGTDAGGRTVVDASGCTVVPGFVDLHTHCDFSLPAHPRADSMVRQGVTTVVVGNCGFSVAPVPQGERFDLYRGYTAFLGSALDWSWRGLGEYLDQLDRLPLALDVVPLVGHGTVRAAVVGYEARPADGAELDAMAAEVADAMEAGAFGLSSGLIYPPGLAASTEELVALARVAGRYGGLYATHMRNEGPQVLSAMEEAFAVARGADVPLQISHHKIMGRTGWGRSAETLARIDAERRAGLEVGVDQYPYEASATNMSALVPGWLLDGGTAAMQERLADPEVRARARSEVLDGPPDGRRTRDFEPDLVTVAAVDGSGEAPEVGRTLEGLAAEAGVPAVDLLLDLLARHGGAVEVVIAAIGDEDLVRIMRDPEVAVASDGWTLHPDVGGRPHPRSYGTFSRVLGHFVRERGVLDLAEAVRKMTSLPARRLGLSDRGRVAPGARADLVVLDPDAVTDTATFAAPHSFAEGVRHVLVGGQVVVSEGSDTGAAAGAVVRRR